MVFPSAGLVSRWLPRLHGVRGISVSPVVRDSNSTDVASEAKIFLQILRKDAVSIFTFLGFGCIVGYTGVNVSLFAESLYISYVVSKLNM